MAYELVFTSTERSEVESTLIARANQFNEIFIQIDAGDYPPCFLCLDKETAIRFAKELRKQISFLEEVNNG
jgi:hypothetical protein